MKITQTEKNQFADMLRNKLWKARNDIMNNSEYSRESRELRRQAQATAKADQAGQVPN